MGNLEKRVHGYEGNELVFIYDLGCGEGWLTTARHLWAHEKKNADADADANANARMTTRSARSTSSWFKGQVSRSHD